MQSLLTGRAQRIQLAADGEWEKSLMLSHCASQFNDMTLWLHAAPRNVALEVFLADDAGHEQFFGVRLSTLSKPQQTQFCSAALTFFDVPGHRTAQDMLQFAQDALAAPQLLNGKPAFLELGVVNAWRSTGPVRFAPSASATTAVLALRQALEQHSRYREPHPNPIAIELACDMPLPHWLGIVVSRQEGFGHRIDVDAAAALCRAVGSIHSKSKERADELGCAHAAGRDAGLGHHLSTRLSAILPIPAAAPLLHLLQECRLPVADIATCDALQFFGCFDGAQLIGVVGLEPHGEIALLRSLAVMPAQRARGLGKALVAHAERQAATQGIASLYLLTTTAAGFFAARGYTAVPRSEAPAAIQSTAQFSGLCPASSAFMTKPLRP